MLLKSFLSIYLLVFLLLLLVLGIGSRKGDTRRYYGEEEAF